MLLGTDYSMCFIGAVDLCWLPCTVTLCLIVARFCVGVLLGFDLLGWYGIGFCVVLGYCCFAAFGLWFACRLLGFGRVLPFMEVLVWSLLRIWFCL